MAFEAITLDEVQPGKPVTNDLMEKIKYNFDYLYGLLGASGVIGVPNQSFEIDADEDGVPDQWTKNLYAGGGGAYETDDVIHGARAFKFTHPGGAGNGGGYLTSDYIEAAGGSHVGLRLWLKCSAAGIKVEAKLLCYDEDKIALAGGDADRTAYTSVANPIVWANVGGTVDLPADTRYVKVQLHGGVDDTDVAGTVLFDFPNLLITQTNLHHEVFEAGDELLQSANTTRNITETSWYLVKSIKLARGGTVRTYFELSGLTGNYQSYAQIRRNGVAVGTIRTKTVQDWEAFTEDIAGWTAGDHCEVWCYVVATAVEGIRNFRVYVDDLFTTVQITD